MTHRPLRRREVERMRWYDADRPIVPKVRATHPLQQGERHADH
jgi:hypothetical protein